MLEIVRHGVGKPRDPRVELPAGSGDMLESLLDGYGLDESITFRMGKGFVNIIERQFFTLLPIVVMDCLQTGDITQKGRSGQAAEDDHGMPALEFLPEGEAAPLGVEHADVGHEATNLGHVLTTASTSASTVLSQDHGLEGTGYQQENRNLESHHHLR